MIFHKKIEAVYQAQLFARCDDTGMVYYFTHEDFPGLAATPYGFQSSLGHNLQGYFYSYPGANPDRLVIFDHGFGGGHRSYMKEIERLCRAGYRVFAYDHTGCMASGGTGARGFAQSLHDLDDCLKALKRDPQVSTDHITVLGHSWGGFATLNIPALHPDVEKIVVLSGFVSVEKIIAQNFAGLLKGYRKHILQLEYQTNPDYVTYDGVTSLQGARTEALLVYSDNDHLVHKSVHFDALQAAFQDDPRVRLMLVQGKGHNPNYTAEAVALLGELAVRTKQEGKQLTTPEAKAAFRNSFDWGSMTAQDDEVWQQILCFLQ